VGTREHVSNTTMAVPMVVPVSILPTTAACPRVALAADFLEVGVVLLSGLRHP
jgi:hypothetical protein